MNDDLGIRMRIERVARRFEVGEQIRAVKGAAGLAVEAAKSEGSTSGGTPAAGGQGQGSDFPYVQIGIAAVVLIGGFLLVGRLRKRRA